MKVNEVNVPYVIKPRRPGDIATCYCNPAKAKAELGWQAQYGLKKCTVIVGTGKKRIQVGIEDLNKLYL